LTTPLYHLTAVPPPLLPIPTLSLRCRALPLCRRHAAIVGAQLLSRCRCALYATLCCGAAATNTASSLRRRLVLAVAFSPLSFPPAFYNSELDR
jgi:hypothetical protein